MNINDFHIGDIISFFNDSSIIYYITNIKEDIIFINLYNKNIPGVSTYELPFNNFKIIIEGNEYKHYANKR